MKPVPLHDIHINTHIRYAKTLNEEGRKLMGETLTAYDAADPEEDYEAWDAAEEAYQALLATLPEECFDSAPIEVAVTAEAEVPLGVDVDMKAGVLAIRNGALELIANRLKESEPADGIATAKIMAADSFPVGSPEYLAWTRVVPMTGWTLEPL